MRIIPARAGFTTRTGPAPTCPWDHPRTRGVYACARELAATWTGSSPHARGLLTRGRSLPDWSGSSPHARGLQALLGHRHHRPRIIPARAGFTDYGQPALSDDADHPRTRGVYPAGLVLVHRVLGSSPHARGLHEINPKPLDISRIIPARAGFTCYDGSRKGENRDHPRTRGVYIIALIITTAMGGSSPHARGLPQECPWRSPGQEDHPRTRGVYELAARNASGGQGSSPHARGLRRDADALVMMARIIPARAGFTRTDSTRLRMGRDHPRTRGVYPTRGRDTSTTTGSSPHARGLRGRVTGVTWPLGIIPARAGFTPA